MPLFTHSYHQTILSKFYLKIFYLPLYERTVCHLIQVNPDHMKRSPFDLFVWGWALNYLDVNEQVSVFNDKITNTLANFVPNEILICLDWDPPRMIWRIKNLILYEIISTQRLYVEKTICSVILPLIIYKII